MRNPPDAPAALSTALTVVLTVALAVGGCAAGAPAGDPSRAADDPSRAAGESSRAAGEPALTFAAAGDLGANRTTAAGLARLDASRAELFLALGDLDYDQTPSDAAWCDYVLDRLPTKGPDFPFEVLAGNHEADGGDDGRVARHARCLPDRMAAVGSYPAQYAFDAPAQDPLVRFVLVSPRLTVEGHRYDYRRGTQDRAWLAGQLATAREAGLWTVVGMHYPCLSTGSGHPGCSSGRAVHNLVLRLGADLLVTGHNHVYERSKQLALSAACPRVGGRYDAACVADAGGDGAYRRDAGTVQVTSGRFGGRPMTVDPDDPDRRWFVRARARTTGYLQVRVTRERLAARYLATTGDVRDRFVVE